MTPTIAATVLFEITGSLATLLALQRMERAQGYNVTDCLADMVLAA
ncbi:hypothetical protein J3R80_10725 [Aliiroseovarius sp. Z3]|nr:hypothetical protein [Aliiroseovarius sp. Z3]MDE9450939.1 hypothetical protein [Aliiroseovarius sp. Z3]